MNDPSNNDLSLNELYELLYTKKRHYRQDRLRRMQSENRLVAVDNKLPDPDIDFPTIVNQLKYDDVPVEFTTQNKGEELTIQPLFQRIQWRWIIDKLLFAVEVSAVAAFIVIILSFVNVRYQLNQELANLQKSDFFAIPLPTPTITSLIKVAILPSGHKPPIDGRPPEPGEAGYVPDHLLPIINNYVAPPVPTPSPEQARRVQIPAINVDSTIVQGDDWEQLKKGVGQHIGSAIPGQTGNLILSAHNDIYGEIFRHLDKLAPGNEIIISTERQNYTYIVRDIDVVEPTDVWVMEPTTHASTTLISCYPYLVNDKRIVIFADLAEG